MEERAFGPENGMTIAKANAERSVLSRNRVFVSMFSSCVRECKGRTALTWTEFATLSPPRQGKTNPRESSPICRQSYGPGVAKQFA